MAEYNFWDDRTWEDNDDIFCPIKNGSCFSQDCEKCAINFAYEKYLNCENENAKGQENA